MYQWEEPTQAEIELERFKLGLPDDPDEDQEMYDHNLDREPDGGCDYPWMSIDPSPDPGVYSSDGRKIGSTCGCEDYPCCGH